MRMRYDHVDDVSLYTHILHKVQWFSHMYMYDASRSEPEKCIIHKVMYTTGRKNLGIAGGVQFELSLHVTISII